MINKLDNTPGDTAKLVNDDLLRFEQLQKKLAPMYRRIFPDRLAQRTVVVVPSLTLDPAELAKIDGAHHYEERMLYLLMLLRLPNTRLIYVTSQPISQTVVDYFLHLLPGIPSTHARRRLTLFDCCDASPLPLVQKILNRPRLINKIRGAISETESAHMSCFNSTHLERELAIQLGIPLYANDPELRHLGSKSGSRNTMMAAGIPVPEGFEDLHHEKEIIQALTLLKNRNPSLRKAVVKLNEGFSGEGNATFSFADSPATGMETWIQNNVAGTHQVSKLPPKTGVRFAISSGSWAASSNRLSMASRNVLRRFNAESIRSEKSRSFRLMIKSSVGPAVRSFWAARFRHVTNTESNCKKRDEKSENILRDRGVIGRFGIDFVSVREPAGWKHYAIEINLRKGGTTHPFMMLQFLTNGNYDCNTGEFVVPGGGSRCYFASDNLCDESYRGLGPEDLIDIAVENNLHYHSTLQQGVIFHLIGALSEFGKLGVLCIGDSRDGAKYYYDQTLEALKKPFDRSASRTT